eukprot:5580619-Pleurochrysis_carterae.AAC.1
MNARRNASGSHSYVYSEEHSRRDEDTHTTALHDARTGTVTRSKAQAHPAPVKYAQTHTHAHAQG